MHHLPTAVAATCARRVGCKLTTWLPLGLQLECMYWLHAGACPVLFLHWFAAQTEPGALCKNSTAPQQLKSWPRHTACGGTCSCYPSTTVSAVLTKPPATQPVVRHHEPTPVVRRQSQLVHADLQQRQQLHTHASGLRYAKIARRSQATGSRSPVMQQCQEVLKIGIHCKRHIQCCAQRQICSRPGCCCQPPCCLSQV